MNTPASPQRPDGMTVRHLDVDISQGFPIYWNNNDAYRSQLLNGLSFMFPVGEQFFIDSVRHFAKDVAAQGKAELAEEIKLFIGQEATHRHLHQQYNDHLVAKGYSPWVERTLARVIKHTAFFDPRTKLAITVAYEHFRPSLVMACCATPAGPKAWSPPCAPSGCGMRLKSPNTRPWRSTPTVRWVAAMCAAWPCTC